MDPYEHIVHLYDLEHDAYDEDASFFENLVRAGPVLELGCGTGRIVERLARSGLEIHGIDMSSSMLAAARRRLEDLPNAHVHLMSIENLDTSVGPPGLPHAFRFAIWPLNVLWHLRDLESQLRSLRSVRDRLNQDGLLVVDLSNPLNMMDRLEGNEVRLRFRVLDGSTLVQGFSSAQDHLEEQILELSLWYDETGSDGLVHRTSTSLALRYTYRFELELMLERAGFRIAQTYGSYDLESYASDSPNLLVVCTVD